MNECLILSILINATVKFVYVSISYILHIIITRYHWK